MLSDTYHVKFSAYHNFVISAERMLISNQSSVDYCSVFFQVDNKIISLQSTKSDETW